MEKNTVLEFDNRKFLLLDGVKFNGAEYFTAMNLREKDNPLNAFGMLKIVEDKKGMQIGPVTDQRELLEVSKLISQQPLPQQRQRKMS